MLLQKSMHFHPGLESQHPANGGLRQSFGTVAFKGQCLKRNPRRVLALGSDLPCNLVRDVESDLHRIKDSIRSGHPRNVSVTLDTITRAARALGKRVIIRVADVKTKRA